MKRYDISRAEALLASSLFIRKYGVDMPFAHASELFAEVWLDDEQVAYLTEQGIKLRELP